MKPTIIFLMNSLDLVRGGLTRASMKQASFFAELGYETFMLTFNFNPKYPLIFEELKKMNKLHEKVIVKNLYNCLEPGFTKSLKGKQKVKKASLEELTEGLPYDKRKKHNAYRAYKNGTYYKYISLDSNNVLEFIDYFNENRYRVKRENYDPFGNVKRVIYMDIITNTPRQIIYYDSLGNPYISEWINPETKSTDRIIRFSNKQTVSKVYVNDNTSIKVDWLNNFINNINNGHVVVVSDTRSTDSVLLNLRNSKAIKLWRLHSNHLAPPYKNDSKLSPKIKHVLDNHKELDGVIFLTEEQKKDIEKLYGENKKFKVIPHFHNKKQSLLNCLIPLKREKTDTKLAVIVSRFSTLKRIEDSIKAFSIVVQQLPDVRLEIWGTGDQENKLEKLIKKLNLTNNVFIKGYTHHPDKIYQRALFSTLTSKSEGFSLSVLECMVNKTPMISYNIKYGPRDMIVDGQNGYLIENGDINALAEKMIFLFKNPHIAKKMGNSAHKYINKHFNRKIYKEKWLEVINFALKNK